MWSAYCAISALACIAIATTAEIQPAPSNLGSADYLSKKLKEWTDVNPEVTRRMRDFEAQRDGAHAESPAHDVDNPFDVPKIRGLQSSTCTEISNARDCCKTGRCDLCYGGLSWAFMNYLNMTQAYYDAFQIQVSDAQKKSTAFCGMPWETCQLLRNVLFFDVLDDNAKKALANFGMEPVQFYEAQHCPQFLYQQLWDGAFPTMTISALGWALLILAVVR